MTKQRAAVTHNVASEAQMRAWVQGPTESWMRRAQLRDVLDLVGLPVSKAVKVMALWRSSPSVRRRR